VNPFLTFPAHANCAPTHHRNIEFEWIVGDDPMGSDHLPIVIHLFNKLLISSGVPLSNDVRPQKRPKLCFRNFDKDIFSILIQEKIKSFPSTQGLKDPLQIWCDFILDCSLMAGAIVYDGFGNKKEFSKGKFNSFSLNNCTNPKKEIKEIHNSPWWDKECAILVNKRKWAYKKLSKCQSRDNLLNYRNISTMVRKELQKKKRNSFREFVSSLNLASGPVKFWDTIRKFKNSHYLL